MMGITSTYKVTIFNVDILLRSLNKSELTSHNSCGTKPSDFALFSIFYPCSSVHVRKSKHFTHI